MMRDSKYACVQNDEEKKKIFVERVKMYSCAQKIVLNSCGKWKEQHEK